MRGRLPYLPIKESHDARGRTPHFSPPNLQDLVLRPGAHRNEVRCALLDKFGDVARRTSVFYLRRHSEVFTGSDAVRCEKPCSGTRNVRSAAY